MRLIDADELYLAIVSKGQSSTRYHLGENWELNGQEIREVLDDIPTADVQEVKHGRWIHNKEGIELVCSVCGGFAPLNYFKYHRVRSEYCPNCGTKIDL